MRLIFTFICLLSFSVAFGQSVTLTPRAYVNASNLVGTGNRTLYADPTGTIHAGSAIDTLIVSPQAFQRRYGNGSFVSMGAYGDCFISGANISDNLVAPVMLPMGAIIKKVEAFYTDNDATNNLRFYLSYAKLDETANSTVCNLFQVTNNTNPYDVSTISSGVLNEVVTRQKSYYLFVLPANNNGGTGVWNYTGGASNFMSVKGIRITYQR